MSIPQTLPSCRVKARVKELKEQFQEHIEERFELSKEQAVAYLIGILKTPVGHIDENHLFAQSMRPNKYGLEISMPSKVAAMRELREMLPGWTAKTQIEVGPSQELVELLRAVRNGQPLPDRQDYRTAAVLAFLIA